MSQDIPNRFDFKEAQPRIYARWEESGGFHAEPDEQRLEAVTAQHVVLCTNAYTDSLWPGLKQTFTPIHYFQVATEPLGERTAHVLPGRQGLWDTGKVMFSMRKDESGRLVLGGMGKLIGGEAGLSRHWADKTLRGLFPELGKVGWEKAWHGRIAMTEVPG